jgi:hypothetical protein
VRNDAVFEVLTNLVVQLKSLVESGKESKDRSQKSSELSSTDADSLVQISFLVLGFFSLWWLGRRKEVEE